MQIAGERMGLSENKFVRLSGTRLAEQKPFRGFDITSLIRKDGAPEEGEHHQRASSVNRVESKSTNLGQRSRHLHQSSHDLTHMITSLAKDYILFSQEKTERAQCWAQGPPARLRTSAWVPLSPLLQLSKIVLFYFGVDCSN